MVVRPSTIKLSNDEKTSQAAFDNTLNGSFASFTDESLNDARFLFRNYCGGYFTSPAKDLTGVSYPKMSKSRAVLTFAGQSGQYVPHLLIFAEKDGSKALIEKSLYTDDVAQSLITKFNDQCGGNIKEGKEYTDEVCYKKAWLSSETINYANSEAKRLISDYAIN